MKKFAVVAAAFAALAMAGVAQAQGTGAPEQHQHRADGRGGMGRGGPGGMMMEQMLFKGITLTDAQKAKIDSMHQAERSAMQAQRGQGRPDFEAIREARAKGDTVTANKLMAEQRAKMEAQHQAHLAAVRAILAPDQQKQFDANVAAMKQHQGEWGRGHGMRPDTAPKPKR